jgi:hypothetical protein
MPTFREAYDAWMRAHSQGDVDAAPEHLRYIGLLSDVYGAFLQQRPG